MGNSGSRDIDSDDGDLYSDEHGDVIYERFCEACTRGDRATANRIITDVFAAGQSSGISSYPGLGAGPLAGGDDYDDTFPVPNFEAGGQMLTQPGMDDEYSDGGNSDGYGSDSDGNGDGGNSDGNGDGGNSDGNGDGGGYGSDGGYGSAGNSAAFPPPTPAYQPSVMSSATGVEEGRSLSPDMEDAVFESVGSPQIAALSPQSDYRPTPSPSSSSTPATAPVSLSSPLTGRDLRTLDAL
jgi:hypothetical protein